jgi:adenylate cyclase class IV
VIEVEKKFSSDKGSEKTLIEGADFINERIFKDSYFDDENFSLTTKDIWFRDREGRYELKLPLNENIEKRISDQYHELETEKEIAGYFKWDLSKKPFSEWLSESGYRPFATYTTTR